MSAKSGCRSTIRFETLSGSGVEIGGLGSVLEIVEIPTLPKFRHWFLHCRQFRHFSQISLLLAFGRNHSLKMPPNIASPAQAESLLPPIPRVLDLPTVNKCRGGFDTHRPRRPSSALACCIGVNDLRTAILGKVLACHMLLLPYRREGCVEQDSNGRWESTAFLCSLVMPLWFKEFRGSGAIASSS